MTTVIEVLRDETIEPRERISIALQLATQELVFDVAMTGKTPNRNSILNDLEIVADDARAAGEINLEFLVRNVIRRTSSWIARRTIAEAKR